MRITRKFTTAGTDPFATVTWTTRSSRITNPDGSVVFQMDDAEVPSTWSQLATDIVVSKYFRKAGVPQSDGSTGPERSVKQVVRRLAGCWRFWGESHGYFDAPEDAQAFQDELEYMLVHQVAAPNSPQWFNTGLNWAYGITGPAQGHFVPDAKTGEVTLAADAYTHPQPHACFIQSIEDDLVNPGGIMDLWTREARLFKYGSGTGTNFSRLRGENEKLSGGGKSSGLMSWLRIGDRAAGAIKSGGTTRRAAKMVCLDMDHPDIEQFINWKVREEIKVAALVEGMRHLPPDQRATAKALGLTLDYDFNGEAYQTVSGQNSNNSIRVPDAFFRAVDADGDWTTTWRLSGKPARTFKARELWERVGFAAWRCADPGVQYDTTINAWHTCPSAGRINASNPCVTGDTLVATADGLHRIDALVGRTVEVLGADGKKSFVERVFKTGHKPVYTLTTRSGYTLKVTADHKVFTLNRGDVPACELTVDDVVQLRGHGFGNDFLPPAAAELLGAALGDGCITRGEVQDHLFVSIGFGEGDLARELAGHVDWCKGWLSGMGEGDGRSTRPTNPATTATGVRVQASTRSLLSVLSRLAVLDAGSENKALTDVALATLDRAAVAGILRGLFSTDGTVADFGEKSQYVALDSTSLKLLQQVQVLLLGLGVKSKLCRDRRALGQTTARLPDGKGGTADYPVRQVHSLRISRSSRVAFEREVGFMASSPKGARLAALNAKVGAYADRMTDRVSSLEYAGEEDVFDLTEPRTHHFVANGVVVHNCSEYMFLDNTACNLASINLIKFYDSQTREFDVKGFEHAIDLWTVVLEISVLMAAYPSHEVAALSWKYRTLGLGYANLGAMLMLAGLAYDSDESRAVCGCITSILTGRAYRQSALMASQLGAFPGYEADAQSMLRVVRNHRLAAHGEARTSGKYEDLPIRPVPIDHALIDRGTVTITNAQQLRTHATEAWDDALDLGKRFGYRNAQVTVIAPTGTIGLLMDCDTTGIEPDFALVKFKKLAGGGYFKIANASVRAALEALGYSDRQTRDVLTYLLGTLTLDTPLPGESGATLKSFLMGKGLSAADVAKINDALPGVFELSFAFSAWGLGDETLARAGVDAAAAKADPNFNLLRHLGLTREQVDQLNDSVCGRQTVEGAPHLRAEHLPVFDCANKCGKHGKRSIAPEGHIRMMAAAQPFISGAISKTINLPNEATVADVMSAYRLSWELGLKANALYRDGCKLSQPLSTSSESKDETKETAKVEAKATSGAAARAREEATTLVAGAVESVERAASEQAVAELVAAVAPAAEAIVKVVERPMRRRLPDTRASITHKFNIAGHEGYLTVGLYEDGMPGELFITMAKEGSTIGGLMDCIGTSVSVALQYGVPVESLVNKFTHQRFEPAGMTTNREIPFAKSLVDYIFRWMGIQFVPGYREANTPGLESARDGGETGGEGDGGRGEGDGPDFGPRMTIASAAAAPVAAASAGHSAHAVHSSAHGAPGAPAVEAGGTRAGRRVSALAKAMENSGDGPACEVCGTITVRNGRCYKCVNCGSSVGGCS
jgi:ribonucleoside-diphosphate reductase alpha chain